MLEYASSRTIWRCWIARRFPSVIVAIASAAKIGFQKSAWWMNATNISWIRPAKPAAFDATERNAATGTGEPSYVSGAQNWNGTADTLNPNPTMMRRMLAKTTESGWWMGIGYCFVERTRAISYRLVDFVTP